MSSLQEGKALAAIHDAGDPVGYTDSQWKAVWASMSPVDVAMEQAYRNYLTGACFHSLLGARVVAAMFTDLRSDEVQARHSRFIQQLTAVIETLSADPKYWTKNPRLVPQLQAIKQKAAIDLHSCKTSPRVASGAARDQIWGFLLRFWFRDLTAGPREPTGFPVPGRRPPSSRGINRHH